MVRSQLQYYETKDNRKLSLTPVLPLKFLYLISLVNYKPKKVTSHGASYIVCFHGSTVSSKCK
jgi:hypothetical protein